MVTLRTSATLWTEVCKGGTLGPPGGTSGSYYKNKKFLEEYDNNGQYESTEYN